MGEVPLIMMVCIVLLIPYGVYQDWIKPRPVTRRLEQ